MELGTIKLMPRIKRGLLEGRFHSGPPAWLKVDQSGGSEKKFEPLI
jgi:hypothetical protein